ncbi:hypothetical protein LBMAG53_03260 [Planctomycetota bacterium]|nr:hypothetical protein LBMAG53_03260 [Planctomycetota bacterium]
MVAVDRGEAASADGGSRAVLFGTMGSGEVRLRRLRDPQGREIDQAVVVADGDQWLVCCHGGPGVRAAVTAALIGHGYQDDGSALTATAGSADTAGLAETAGLTETSPLIDARWRRLAAAAHPAAVAWLLANNGTPPFPERYLASEPIVLITGPANAGKSTLLNAWCGRQRALVSALPGTTRDLVAASALVHGWRLRLLDSAGLRATSDPLEQAGQDLVAVARQQADVVLYLDDPGQPEPGPRPGDLVIRGKADLRPAGGDWSAVDHSPARLDALGRRVLERLGLPVGPADPS